MGGKVLKLKVDVAYDKGYKEGFNEGFNEGFKKGLNESHEEVRTHVIPRMLKYGMTVDRIAAATGYATEEILRIQDPVKKIL